MFQRNHHKERTPIPIRPTHFLSTKFVYDQYKNCIYTLLIAVTVFT